jgi:hypothetical protein
MAFSLHALIRYCFVEFNSTALFFYCYLANRWLLSFPSFRLPRWRRSRFDRSNPSIPVLSISPSCLKSLERIGFLPSTLQTRTISPQR